MQHQLTVGFIDPTAASQGLLKILKPLDSNDVRDCLKKVPWIGWEGDMLVIPGGVGFVSVRPVIKLRYLDYRGKLDRPALEIATRLQRDLGCVVSDYNHGVVYTAAELDSLFQRA
jgi:hypothetical protein